MNSSAGFSTCRTWRYWLTRRWDESKATLVVIGLNPSTADEEKNDPTIRRCISYAKDWGFGQLTMLNDAVLQTYTKDAGMIIAAWGAHGGFQGRSAEVLKLLADRSIYALGFTQSGEPKHPLYLRADTQPIRMVME